TIDGETKIFHDKTKFTQYRSANPFLKRIIDGNKHERRRGGLRPAGGAGGGRRPGLSKVPAGAGADKDHAPAPLPDGEGQGAGRPAAL
ncbi:MAG: hypothetical protein HFF27_07000, partial [Oscillospiraceae bacterium]|nr:hypothetical protein [Oscillospiraceae bacterium]